MSADSQDPSPPSIAVNGEPRLLWAAAAAVAAFGNWMFYDALPGINWIMWTAAATTALLAFSGGRGQLPRFVLVMAGAPIVMCTVDWTGILNEAHLAWRTALAEAAGTTPDRVAVHCVHQHNAPLVCYDAERMLKMRLDRLEQLGQVSLIEGRYRLKAEGRVLYAAASILAGYRSLLGV